MKEKTIKELLQQIEENERKQIQGTIEECMKSICCENVKWQEFYVCGNEQIFLDILKGMKIHYLLPIAEASKEENKRKVKIFCIKAVEDEYQIFRVNAMELHAVIYISIETLEYLSSEAEKHTKKN